MDGIASPPTQAPSQPDWVPRYRISADIYQRMGAAGLFPPDARVELIEGELLAMSPVGTPHVMRVMHLNELLSAAVRGRALVSVQSPIRLSDFSEPEPNVALVHRPANRYAEGLPKPDDIFLLIEVSDSTLLYDKTVKAALYARHGIAEYWIVDVTGPGALIVHRDPKDGAYTVVRDAAPDETLEPLLLPGLRLPVADLLA